MIHSNICVLTNMRNVSRSNKSHCCFGLPRIIHVLHEGHNSRLGVRYYVELSNNRGDCVIVNNASVTVHYVSQHMKDNCPLYSRKYFLHCVLRPRLPDMP